MRRERNFLPWAGFAVCAAALLSYPLFFARFPATRDVPWANWLLFALGFGLVGMGVVRAFRAPERFRGRVAGPVLGVLSLAVLAGFLFLTLFYSRQLPAAAGAPQVGTRAPDFTLPDAQGHPVRLSQVLQTGARAQGGAPGAWVLLIFYRGYW
jgi:hypothetical protein